MSAVDDIKLFQRKCRKSRPPTEVTRLVIKWITSFCTKLVFFAFLVKIIFLWRIFYKTLTTGTIEECAKFEIGWYSRHIIVPTFWTLPIEANLLYSLEIGHARPLFLYFWLFITQLTVYKCLILISFCQWLDSNHGPLVSEATSLRTEPQPLPIYYILWPVKNYKRISVIPDGVTRVGDLSS